MVGGGGWWWWGEGGASQKEEKGEGKVENVSFRHQFVQLPAS